MPTGRKPARRHDAHANRKLERAYREWATPLTAAPLPRAQVTNPQLGPNVVIRIVTSYGAYQDPIVGD
jgi:hypothetical protein